MQSESKQREHDTWNLVAEGWRKNDASLATSYRGVTERMLQLAKVGAGARVLDVASGTGEPAIPAAEQVGPNGYVLGTDFVEEMLVVARDKAKRRRLGNVEFRRVDAEELSVDAGAFDAALLRWGLMFMPDPIACLRQLHRALRTGGRVAVACWASPEKNPWVAAPLAAVKKRVDVPPPPPGAPGLFAFADPARLTSALVAAGFVDVAVEEVVANSPPATSGRAHLAWVCELADPLARLASLLTPAQRAEVEVELDLALERHRVGSHLTIPGATLIAHGHK